MSSFACVLLYICFELRVGANASPGATSPGTQPEYHRSQFGERCVVDPLPRGPLRIYTRSTEKPSRKLRQPVARCLVSEDLTLAFARRHPSSQVSFVLFGNRVPKSDIAWLPRLSRSGAAESLEVDRMPAQCIEYSNSFAADVAVFSVSTIPMGSFNGVGLGDPGRGSGTVSNQPRRYGRTGPSRAPLPQQIPWITCLILHVVSLRVER